MHLQKKKKNETEKNKNKTKMVKEREKITRRNKKRKKETNLKKMGRGVGAINSAGADSPNQAPPQQSLSLIRHGLRRQPVYEGDRLRRQPVPRREPRKQVCVYQCPSLPPFRTPIYQCPSRLGFVVDLIRFDSDRRTSSSGPSPQAQPKDRNRA